MNACTVCHSETKAVEFVCELPPYVGKRQRGIQCTACGLIRFPENDADYFSVIENNESEQVNQRYRDANADRPGREFYMAQMAIDILGRPAASINFFGSGLNTDWQWVQRSHPGARVTLIDVKNEQRTSNFRSIHDAEPADITIACEVIEHFLDPVVHFSALLRLLNDRGIVVCSSNIYDGSDICRHVYPFMPGHVAYWTPLALVKVAADAGCFIDFRTPEIGASRAGPRKKYILFYRDIEVLYRISRYFGEHMLAPSERE